MISKEEYMQILGITEEQYDEIMSLVRTWDEIVTSLSKQFSTIIDELTELAKNYEHPKPMHPALRMVGTLKTIVLPRLEVVRPVMARARSHC